MLRFVSHPRYLAQYLANDNIWKFLINWTKIWKCNPKPHRRHSIWPALRVILTNPRSFTAVIGSGGGGGFGPRPTATITRRTEINSTFWYHVLDVLLKGPLRTAEVLHPFSARIIADMLCLYRDTSWRANITVWLTVFFPKYLSWISGGLQTSSPTYREYSRQRNKLNHTTTI